MIEPGAAKQYAIEQKTLFPATAPEANGASEPAAADAARAFTPASSAMPFLDLLLVSADPGHDRDDEANRFVEAFANQNVVRKPRDEKPPEYLRQELNVAD